MAKNLRFQVEISQLVDLTSNLNFAVAVSGGSDSLALCLLIDQWLKSKDSKLVAITIDHQLRPESSEEALQVQQLLNHYDIEHVIIPWLGVKPAGNIQEVARLARYKLLTDYCLQHGIDYLVTGHQQNDQAENFIIRADHGAGIYGLAGIPAITTYNNIKIVRPLLNFTKQELQDYLIERNIKWIEDPSNRNERFARVRVRKFLKNYPQWIKKLANISINLARTKEAVDYLLNQSIEKFVTFISYISKEFFVTLLNKTPIHWPVNNSVMAVPNIQMIIKINSGLANALYILAVETPLATLSVTGNFSLAKSHPYNTVGISIRATSIFQLLILSVPAIFCPKK